MKTRIKLDIKTVSDQFKDANRVPEELRERAYKFFRDRTPIRSGNARRNTKLEDTSIVADYPYAERLDTGWSKQAPDGMTEPTTQFIERELEQLIRKVR